jgi:hypothetical protein
MVGEEKVRVKRSGEGAPSWLEYRYAIIGLRECPLSSAGLDRACPKRAGTCERAGIRR